ncbi:hypothetical protein [Buchnera aphidicola]|uniref:hypothetical protein n=1 Tax=Buchnera aphidicola TaxID=9 RepID=UPI0031B85EBE
MSLTILNLTRFQCPDTMIFFRKYLRRINKKNIILILSNDISIQWDMPLFCNCMNYILIKKITTKKPYYFFIKKNIN